MRAKPFGLTMIESTVVTLVLGVVAATTLPKPIDLRGDALASALRGVAAVATTAHAVNRGGCSVTRDVATAYKCIAVSDCSATPSLVQGGLPTGYTVAAAAIGTGAAGSNGVTAVCTITQTEGGAQARFTGISAGN